MKLRLCFLAFVFFGVGASHVRAQADKVFLRIEPGGPASVLTAVAFSPDGERLYATGYDKVVRVWALNKQTGTFEASKIAFRVPIAPGMAGTINALAVSPDGNWLAVGGFGVMRDRADFRTTGMIFPALGTKTPDMLKDEGTIYVFNTNNERQIKVLRGHAGTILTLAFLPARDGKPPLLVSAAEEPTGKQKEYAAHVRLWDVAKAETLAEETIDTKAPRLTPGLAAWHTGAAAKEVGVALAWGDAQVRVWDVGRAPIEKTDDGRYNNTAALASMAGQFMTASFISPEGAVRLWQADASKAPRLRAESDVRLPPLDRQRGPFYIPRDLATFASRPNGPLDRAVVLARRQAATPNADDQDVLLLLDLTRNTVLARQQLGTFQNNLRRVAVSPTGRHIAVADADRQQIRIFSTADLVEGKGEPRPQVLRGVGTTFGVVSFRKKGNDQGLYLEEVGGAKMIFDFNNRRFFTADDTWKPDAPDKTGWEAFSKQEGDRVVLTVSGPDFKAKSFTLDEKCTLTAGALLPPRKGAVFGPLLALAWLDEFRQPMLALYDVASGVQVRQLAAHVAAVRSLAFTADGRFLASAAADQTVCLWTMTSLDQVLGKAGALPGVIVVEKDKTVQVVQAPKDSALKEGAIVEGVVNGDKLRVLAMPRDFYTSFFDTKPGTEVVLRVRPPGANQAVDVKVKAGQGTDERKPLLSLFVTREGTPAQREWIAWTSLGPYDASSPRAEDYLGWHFNPEKADAPIDFGRADKYRANYETKGILKHLIRTANTVQALDEWKKEPQPDLEVSVDGIDPTGPRLADRPLVRTRALALRVQLPRRFPVERVNAVNWRLDGGPWQPLREGEERTWLVELARLAWGRGPHDLAVRLEIDGGTRYFEQAVAFHYLPEPPRLEWAKEWLQKNFPDRAKTGLTATTKEAAFVVEAQASPGTPGEEIRVFMRQNDDKPVPNEGTKVRQEFKLKEGENIFEIQAVNAGALKDSQSEETALQQVRVFYYRQRPAPQFTIREVVPLTDGAAALVPVPGQPLTVSVPKVRIGGQVRGEEKLDEAKRDNKVMAGFDANTATQFDFKDEITLKPGEQTLRYEAKSKNSPLGTATLRLVYQPPVARLGAARPTDQSSVFEKDIEVKVELTPPDHKEASSAEVLVNGRQQVKQRLDAVSREFKAKATLEPGANRIVVRLANEWGATAAREWQLHYLRPPRLVKFTLPAEVDKAVQDFSAEVDSPAELPPCKAQVNGNVFREERFKAELLDREKGHWRVTLRDVGLQEGNNTLTLVVANTDGDSLQSLAGQVRYNKPLPPKPVVQFRDFKNSEPYEVPLPVQPLAFTVTSTTPLKRIELRGDSDAPLALQAKPGVRTVEETVSVRLKPAKPTTFRLLATNDGGDAEATVTLQVPERPAYVVIERLESLKTRGQFFKPLSDKNDNQGRAIFDVVPDGRVLLHGRVLWNDPNDERFRGKINLRVYANGFQQIPVEAQPPKSRETECSFTATVLLTRAANNLIEVDLPDLKRADGQRNACVVRECTDPIRGRRLHLVVVGIGVKDGKSLKQRALDAIGAKKESGMEGRLQAPPTFEEVIAYEPLVGGVSKGQIIHRLKGVKRVLVAAAPDVENIVLSEVVMVYYQGREMVTAEGVYLLSDDSEGDEELTRTAVSCAEIVDLFSDARGVQVVMLDTERLARAKAEIDVLPADGPFAGTRLGVFHSFWFGQKIPATRLLLLLQQGWSEANNLGSLAKRVDGLRQRLAPELRFSTILPGELSQLEFGGKR